MKISARSRRAIPTLRFSYRVNARITSPSFCRGVVLEATRMPYSRYQPLERDVPGNVARTSSVARHQDRGPPDECADFGRASSVSLPQQPLRHTRSNSWGSGRETFDRLISFREEPDTTLQACPSNRCRAGCCFALNRAKPLFCQLPIPAWISSADGPLHSMRITPHPRTS